MFKASGKKETSESGYFC